MSAVLRHAETAAELAACFPIMRELRPHLASADAFVQQVLRQRAAGYRLLAAWQDAEPVGLAGYRTQENLIRGRFCYVDDLVVQQDARRSGLGARLLDGVATEMRAAGLDCLVLDTAIDNLLGQRFYFRYGMLPTGLHFTRLLHRTGD
jgi:ribosomal protein S18 acetylase RimI-like enzyme